MDFFLLTENLEQIDFFQTRRSLKNSWAENEPVGKVSKQLSIICDVTCSTVAFVQVNILACKHD